MELLTTPEFGPNGELTHKCVAEMMDEIELAHRRHAQSIKNALLRMRRGDTLNLTFGFTFNVVKRE